MNYDLAKEIAAILCRKYEGLFLIPYLCPAGIPTIGYGATYYENGIRVTLLDPPISKEYAQKLLIWMIQTQYLPAVNQLCPNIDKPERLAAIIDFTYNLGISRLKTSTLRKKINASKWSEVPDELIKWDKAAGIILKGLKARRQEESLLCR